jgi:hypothetical protein
MRAPSTFRQQDVSTAPAEVYDLMLGKVGGELQDWSTKAKQRALDGLLAAAPVRGEA